ncbi:MAG: diaminopimelate decarboxylase [Chloroflexi bacterium GWB2_49_20]|nr:MAG: diaminopimelate decarboxylase [Chloroflexi bacterium GWB2_49_20]OGN78040.1 MAG: diaminopimelate decarboxylase [Chloroflexi bacterium GWC2_49_37]OGN85078.1 MAG: diaminopimelate decarboxylase [Chloroflexi bacterium GWD2_49_16]
MIDTPAFQYHSGELNCENVSIMDIISTIGTPFYLYSAARLEQNYQRFSAAFATLQPRIFYSVKANTNLSILHLLKEKGCGFDIVSGGELFRTLNAGASPAGIVFAGVGKMQAELEFAVKSRIGWFNIESICEAERLNSVAEQSGDVVKVALRLRPDVKAGGHPYLVTGHASSKFGMCPDEGISLIKRAADFPYLELGGVHIHIGSQLADPAATLAAIDVVLDFIATSGLGQLTKTRGKVPLLNIGGGFPVPYHDGVAVTSIEDFAASIISRLQPMAANLNFAIEPGRFLTADIGALILSVQYKKEVDGHCVLVVDGGINALLRPALYDAYHRVLPLTSPKSNEEQLLTSIVGPICESSDVLARNRILPCLKPGDCIAILDTGAYGFTMASNYNSQPRPAEVLVEGKTFRLIRRRETYNDLVADES